MCLVRVGLFYFVYIVFLYSRVRDDRLIKLVRSMGGVGSGDRFEGFKGFWRFV